MASKETPRTTKVVAAALFGGLGAAVIGQRYVSWTLESQLNTVIVVAAAALVAGFLAWVLTRRPA
jgi:hypothetical protein